MIIYLGLPSPEDSSDLPGSDSPYGERGGQPLLPYAVLLSGGVYPDPCCHGNAWSLTPRFHPWPSTKLRPVCFLWHFPSLAGPRVTWHLALESSDFPPFGYAQGDHLFCSGSSSLVHGCFVFRLHCPTEIRPVTQKVQPAYASDRFLFENGYVTRSLGIDKTCDLPAGPLQNALHFLLRYE